MEGKKITFSPNHRNKIYILYKKNKHDEQNEQEIERIPPRQLELLPTM